MRTPAQLWSRLRIAVDLRLPDKPVRRRVRGIELELPRHHWLPYFTTGNPYYATNLIRLARGLREAEGRLAWIDIGANVGDTALLVLDEVDADVVCVEPDPEWLVYLERNVGAMRNVAIEPSVVVGPEDAGSSMTLVHEPAGTSHVVQSDDGSGLATISTDELLARHPQLADVRLVKTDTDGHDVKLVPALARTFAASRPVLFFEFDPRATALAAPDVDPNGLWDTLVGIGYEQAAVWDNAGRPLEPAATAELAAKSSILDLPEKERGYGFWDVAVAHRDDPVGRRVLNEALRP